MLISIWSKLQAIQVECYNHNIIITQYIRTSCRLFIRTVGGRKNITQLFRLVKKQKDQTKCTLDSLP